MLLTRYLFVPWIRRKCAAAGAEKFTADGSFGSLLAVGDLSFGTTTLSGSTGFAPAAWTDTPMLSTAATTTAIRTRIVASLDMIHSFLSFADIAAK
jgi:hypothetical protein